MDSDQEDQLAAVASANAPADREDDMVDANDGQPEEEEIPLLMLDPTTSQSKVDVRLNYFSESEAPPPSPEKMRRPRRRRTRQGNDETATRVNEDIRRQSGLELEVEELLDNSTRWRKSQPARIRTPVRRAVLAYAPGSVSPGRRQQVLCDLSAKVRELEVAALSRGLACSLQSAVAGQQPLLETAGAQPDGEEAASASSNRLDPRVRIAYQHLMPAKQTAAVENGSNDSSWSYAGRLQSRGQSRRSRAPGLFREATATTSNWECRPRRAKTSLTMAAGSPAASNYSWSAASVTKADLLLRQSINGEVQRSLYAERTPGLRRLLHAGDVANVGVVGGICGVGGSGLKGAAPLTKLLQGKSSGAVCPPATATGVRRFAATAKY